MPDKIKSFTDLNAWKEGHKLVLMIYKMTEKFPQKETFALTNQLRRCAVSITSNIAEGFSRSSSKDKQHFYTMSATSLAELQNQFLIARDLGYVQENNFKKFTEQSAVVGKLVSGLTRSAINRM